MSILQVLPERASVIASMAGPVPRHSSFARDGLHDPCSTSRGNTYAELWELVLHRLRPLHEVLACDEYLEAFQRLLGDARLPPSQAAVSVRLRELTGFRIERARGSAPPRVFLARLGERVFTAAAVIRPAATPFFTPDPDWIHDLLGHAVFLAHPLGAELYQLFGSTYRPGMSDAEVARLTRLFWHVAEAGVVRQHGRWKALGGALLSSVEELRAFRSASIRTFDAASAADTPFDDTGCQAQLFGARSIGELRGELQYLLARAR